MNSKRHGNEIWSVHRKFEPNRLSHDILAQAYEQIVPQKFRVFPVCRSEMDRNRTAYKAERRQ